MVDVITEDLYLGISSILTDAGYSVVDWYNEQIKGTQIKLVELPEDIKEIDDSHAHLRTKFFYSLIIFAQTRALRNEAFVEIKALFMDRTKTEGLANGKVTLVFIASSRSHSVIDKEIGDQGKYYSKTLIIEGLAMEDFSA